MPVSGLGVVGSPNNWHSFVQGHQMLWGYEGLGTNFRLSLVPAMCSTTQFSPSLSFLTWRTTSIWIAMPFKCTLLQGFEDTVFHWLAAQDSS